MVFFEITENCGFCKVHEQATNYSKTCLYPYLGLIFRVQNRINKMRNKINVKIRIFLTQKKSLKASLFSHLESLGLRLSAVTVVLPIKTVFLAVVWTFISMVRKPFQNIKQKNMINLVFSSRSHCNLFISLIYLGSLNQRLRPPHGSRHTLWEPLL